MQWFGEIKYFLIRECEVVRFTPLESLDWNRTLLKTTTTFLRKENILLGSLRLYIKKKREDHGWILFF